MYQFKAEYQNARVTVKTNSFGKVEVNTSNADANKWAVVPELAFMIEPVNTIEPKQETKVVKYEDMTLKELREMFPDITANSKKAFIEQL